jgi:hypothetical protein
MKLHSITTGVEIIQGVPGSGKSFYMTRKMLDVIVEQRRPFYTNLPLVFRLCQSVLRLRGGVELANLLVQLTEEHFRAFIFRQEQAAKFASTLKTWGREMAASKRDAEIHRMFCEKNGPDILKGEGANWIPGAAVVCIDEVHHWFPQEEQAKETSALRAYLTMHRHHVHWIWVASQDAMQVALPFRRQMIKMRSVRDKGLDRMVWGLRFGMLGIRAIAVSTFTGDQLRDRVADKTPESEEVFFTQFPHHQLIFRLYKSFTHVGSVRRLQRELERARVDAGIVERKEVEPVKPSRIRRWFLGVFFGGLKVAFVLTLLVVAFWVGSKMGGGSSRAASAAVAAKEAAVVWPKWSGRSGDSLVMGRAKVKKGDSLENGARVLAVMGGGRVCLLGHRDVVWMWEFGQVAPREMGARERILERLTGGVVGSGSQRGRTSPAGRAVGTLPRVAHGG